MTSNTVKVSSLKSKQKSTKPTLEFPVSLSTDPPPKTKHKQNNNGTNNKYNELDQDSENLTFFKMQKKKKNSLLLNCY